MAAQSILVNRRGRTGSLLEVKAEMRNAPSSAWDDAQRETFQTFYQEQNQRLFQYAILLTGNRHQAEEALQTAWCQCLTYRETFFRVPEDKRSAWMRTVVRHAIYAQHRKDRCLVPLDPAWDQPAPEAGSEAEICAVIRSMPTEYRVALELKFVLEWKEEKIAEQLGLSLGATYTRISRGRRLLQERLIREGYADGYQRKGQKR